MTTEEKELLNLLDKIGTVRAQELLDIKDAEFIQKAEAIATQMVGPKGNPRMVKDVMIALRSHRGFLKSLATRGRVFEPYELLQDEYKFSELLKDDYDIDDETINDMMYCRPKVNKVASGCGETLIMLTVKGAQVSENHGDVQIGDRLVEVGSNDKRMWGQGQSLVPREIHKRFYNTITKLVPGIKNKLTILPSGKIKSITQGTAVGQLLMKVAQENPNNREAVVKTLISSIFEDTPIQIVDWLTSLAMARIEYLDNFDYKPSPRRYGQVVLVSVATLVMMKYAAEDKFTDFLFIDNNTMDVKHINMATASINQIYKFCNQCKWGSMFSFGSMDASIQLRYTYNGDIKFKKKHNPRNPQYIMPDWIDNLYNFPERFYREMQ